MSIAVPLYGFGASGGGTGGTLTVTAPANVTVTVSKDGKTKTKNSGTTGVVVFKGLSSGTWTLKITGGSQTSSKPVVITADYSTVIAFFAATINITYPAGSACTCTDGTTALTAPDTSGTWACIVPNAGTWTVMATDGSRTKTVTISITSNGQSESATIAYQLVLFDNGTSADEIGGWTGSGDADKVVEGYVQIGGNGGTHRTQTNQAIDITNYDTISFTFVQWTSFPNRTCYFYAAKDNMSYANPAAKKVLTSSDKDTPLTMDISSLRGSFYLGMYSSSSGDGWAGIRIPKIVLE